MSNLKTAQELKVIAENYDKNFRRSADEIVSHIIYLAERAATIGRKSIPYPNDGVYDALWSNDILEDMISKLKNLKYECHYVYSHDSNEYYLSVLWR
jgi:nitrous oxidase accessory protein NosD